MTTDMTGRRTIRNAWRAAMWGGFALLLTLPALAMRLGAEGVDWSPLDFALMGTMLLMLGLATEAAVRVLATWRARFVAIGAALSMFVAIWAELAVGVFGTPFAGT